MAGAAIEIVGLKKDYRGLRPLRVHSLRVDVGERVAISGLDAMAAEVLVNLVTGASLPDEGVVRVFGEETTAIEDAAAWLASLDRLGLVTERSLLLEGVTVFQNLALPLTVDIDPVPEGVGVRVRRLADELGLPAARLDVRAGDVTRIERFQVQLGRALALDPALLLLEHPTASLPRDAVPAIARDLARILRARSAALLALTEDHAFAGAVADRILALEPATGRLRSPGGWRRVP